MEPRHRTVAYILFSSLFLLLSGLFQGASAQQAQLTTFRNFPARLFFIDDTTTAFYLDPLEGVVHVSNDEGKSWSSADIPSGEATMIIEHPFDNHYVFVLGKGTTHYRSQDRGQTWQSFTTPAPAAYVGSPLSFHSDASSYGLILFQATKCEKSTWGWGSICHDETYYTRDAFSSSPELMLRDTNQCQFAHSTKDFRHGAPHDLVFCVASEDGSSSMSLASSRIFSSTDFFKNDKTIVDLGIGAKNSRGVLALAIVSKFAVVALKDVSSGKGDGEMQLYVSTDAQVWSRAHFPHQSSAQLRENAYTIVESSTHSLGIDVLLSPPTSRHPSSPFSESLGTLFVSNSNGTYFVESLPNTNRNDMGFVDYENIVGVEGVGLANIVGNAQEVLGRGVPKEIMSKITFDDGRSWSTITAPRTGIDGQAIECTPSSSGQECSLHLHSITSPHNLGRIFSSPAPGVLMAVGSVGSYLRPYDECDTFMSTDAGVTWRMTAKGPSKYEFGDSGSILVMVSDSEGVNINEVKWSTDFGRNWKTLALESSIRPRALTTVPDSTSQKFILVGLLSRESSSAGSVAVYHLDFAGTRSRQCSERDFDKWYARTGQGKDCVMGHKQWYNRRKGDADCYVGHKFDDPVEHEENCPCTDADFECDFNFVRSGTECVPTGPEPIPANVCLDPEGTYMGSSGYRLIPGNTCDRSRGIAKDEKIRKDCSKAQPEEGEVSHQIFEFPSEVVQYSYFKESTTVLVRLNDDSVWQSRNEGYTWSRLFPDERFVAYYLHSYSHDRAYLITNSRRYYRTTDGGRTWEQKDAPTPPNTFGAQIIHFHPSSDYLIWTGDANCEGNNNDCHAKASYSTNNGGSWRDLESYVRNCAWARDAELKIDSTQVLCESYRDKKGNQRNFQVTENPLQLVGGSQFFSNKRVLFNRVVGFAKFSEFLIVAEYQEEHQSLDLQVSLDGRNFASGVFPASLRPENHAYTILESSTKAVFMHLTTSEYPRPYWGVIMKSNGNGTYFGISIDHVNRNDRGYVDFEKMIGLDGIAVINVVANPDSAVRTGRKELASRITHNDGGSWKPLTPPKTDSNGQAYDCTSTKCSLQIHGYTERYDSRATYSSPSVPGLMMAVGSVGESLAPYTESDTFITRDAGFTWEEVHKDAHLWEFGDSGSIIVIVNDEQPTDRVLYTIDEGATWREYVFAGPGQDKVRVKSIVTVPEDTSRRFILYGYYSRSAAASVAVHLDFSSLTRKKCVLDPENPTNDDFEFWSPAESREERCLFGRRTLYHRRIREANCYIGDQKKIEEKVIETCTCSRADFECEFNHVLNENGDCVLVPGATSLASEETCSYDDDFWYDRTAYRKIPYSTCEGGNRLDRGTAHRCPGVKGHGFFFWLFVLFIPTALASLVGYWVYKRSGFARGTIRLPGGGDLRPAYASPSDSGVLATLASVPWFIVGLASIAWERVSSALPTATSRSRAGYRNVAADEDAQVLRFDDED